MKKVPNKEYLKVKDLQRDIFFRNLKISKNFSVNLVFSFLVLLHFSYCVCWLCCFLHILLNFSCSLCVYQNFLVYFFDQFERMNFEAKRNSFCKP